MKCEACQQDHAGIYGSGRFCSKSCASSYGRSSLTPERKAAVRALVSAKLNKQVVKSCPICAKQFLSIYNTCSRKCGTTFGFNSQSAEAKVLHAKRSSDRMIKRYADGDTSIGWQSRTGSSYPESYFEMLLSRDGFLFEREVKIGRWFADFVIGKTVLEIDGRQHDDRKEQDALKDEYLRANGYHVVRIEWRNLKVKSKRDEMLNAYEAFKLRLNTP
jgi:very-short-patch-repair endonuclease